ncbi:potassium channel family protein [Thermococcus thioreducens]|uniref:Uncharacterized protein YjbI, contains pentapeptide repeats n=1 Tax=Thermococcus thioreducens TaxID=277988 RepID=A0A0Q2MT16_9EURY|nr:pentapeptide repeat-containing protein [Thermococcus thioreducens]ASJ13160.1 hypothetical protein A3L14_09795 [Thermococcus thioreducens]KQH82879.1 hypothetical protein AMR53_03415 [Thermococcus thioreducens]SEW20290.1 Uncharacterized protein YjbI, contains pentapeptide repeats [Thermococcus thioreducens]
MCRMAHFGNCDPETADQEYCVFHKPNKSEEEAVEFYRKFLERFKPRVEEVEVDGEKIKRLVFEDPVDAKGFVFPPLISFEDVIFKKSVSFEKAKFEGSVSFSGTIFEKDAEFIDCIFNGLGSSSFSECVFCKRVDFSGSQFRGEVDFRYTEFKEESVFWGTTFEENVDFREAIFHSSVSFVNVSFMKEANFRDTSFGKSRDSHTNFWKSIFESPAIFWNAKFHSKLDFWSVKFKGVVSFAEATFYSEATFREVEFHNSVTFHSAIFENSLIFDSSTFNSSETFFWGTKFMGDVRFDFVAFNRGCSFKVRPDFVISKGDQKELKTEFYGGLKFSNVDIRMGIEIDLPSEWFKLPEAEIEARRVQRLSYEKEGKRDEADRMFVLERRAYRKVLKNRAKEKYSNSKTPYQKFEAILFLIYVYISTAIEAILADWISLYGTSWGRIILSSFWVITVNAILYQALSHFSHVVILGIPIGTIYTNGASEGIPGLLNALYYSLVTFTTLGYGDMHPTGWLKALSAIEALTGAVFMALIVAVIARKWMR